MADSLDFIMALRFATQLKAIPDFPRDQEVVDAHAHHLVRWCKGAILDGRNVWSAEAQANWLVTEAQEGWDKWLGTAALHAIFRAKFLPDDHWDRQQVTLGDKPPILCSRCKDNGTVQSAVGYVYCACEQGQKMAGDDGLGQGWLDRLNGVARKTKKLATPSFSEQERSFHEHQMRVGIAITQAEAVLEDPQSSPGQKELARLELETYGGKAKKKRTKKGAGE